MKVKDLIEILNEHPEKDVNVITPLFSEFDDYVMGFISDPLEIKYIKVTENSIEIG